MSREEIRELYRFRERYFEKKRENPRFEEYLDAAKRRLERP